MTICIGALCAKGEGVVACADHMVTGGDVQFEQASSKITSITDRCVALTAGPALTHTEVFDLAKARISGLADPSVRQIVEEVKSAFAEVRNARAEERFLRPLGLTYHSFLQNQSALASDTAFNLSRQITGFELGLQVVIAGVDGAGGHLYGVADPGTAECFDALGFITIGSGHRHAEAAFIAHSYTQKFSIGEAAFIAFEARRRAEAAPGVGSRLTDLIYIGSDIVPFEGEVMQSFDDAYRQLRKQEDKARNAMREVMNPQPDSSDVSRNIEGDNAE